MKRHKPKPLYKNYFTMEELAKMFNFSSLQSFSGSSAKNRYIEGINKVIQGVLDQVHKDIDKRLQ